MVARKAKRIGRRKFSQFRLLVAPFVDRPIKRRLQHALVAQARRHRRKSASCSCMRWSIMIIRAARQPDHRTRVIWQARRAYRDNAVMTASAISIAFSKSGSYGVSRKLPSGSSTWITACRLRFRFSPGEHVLRQDHADRIADLLDLDLRWPARLPVVCGCSSAGISFMAATPLYRMYNTYLTSVQQMFYALAASAHRLQLVDHARRSPTGRRPRISGPWRRARTA